MTDAAVDLEYRAIEAEAFETPRWAVDAILRSEILTRWVFDPCAGGGVLLDAARDCGYIAIGLDKYDWSDRGDIRIADFLAEETPLDEIAGMTVLMNPPFSLAEQFVTRALALDARKVVCFQRFAWWESAGRRDFWSRNPPVRIYVCGNRATCWRIDIPPDRRKSGTTTAHAWFVWERGQPAGTTVGHVYKGAR